MELSTTEFVPKLSCPRLFGTVNVCVIGGFAFTGSMFDNEECCARVQRYSG